MQRPQEQADAGAAPATSCANPLHTANLIFIVASLKMALENVLHREKIAFAYSISQNISFRVTFPLLHAQAS